MSKNKLDKKLYTRVQLDETEKVSQEESRRRFKNLFLLLWEINQQNKVTKGHEDVIEN